MKFMLMINGDAAYEAGQPPNPQLMAAMGPYVEKMAQSGVLVETAGLLPTSHGSRMTVSGGAFTVTDGPFSEAKEVIGGYAIVEVESKEEALAVSRDFLQLHVDVLGSAYTAVAEIRPMMGMTCFTPAQA
jgi:hypothetical protein